MNDMFTISATVYEMLAISVFYTLLIRYYHIHTRSSDIRKERTKIIKSAKQHMLPNVDFVKDYQNDNPVSIVQKSIPVGMPIQISDLARKI